MAENNFVRHTDKKFAKYISYNYPNENFISLDHPLHNM